MTENSQTDEASDQGIVYTSGATEFIPCFYMGLCYFIFGFQCSVVLRIVSFYPVVIVLSLLQFTASYYPFWYLQNFSNCINKTK